VCSLSKASYWSSFLVDFVYNVQTSVVRMSIDCRWFLELAMTLGFTVHGHEPFT